MSKDYGISADYKGLKEYHQKKKQDMYKIGILLLQDLDLPYKQLNTYHFRICDKLDFWPSTFRWHNIKTNKRGRGSESLKAQLKVLIKELT